MKKRLILVFLAMLLFLISSDFSSSVILSKNSLSLEYNFGDNIKTEGKILLSKDASISFKIKIICTNDETLLLTKRYNVKKDTETGFSVELFLPFSTEKDCLLKYDVVENNQIIDSTESNRFKIKKDLKTSIDIDRKELVLGEKIMLKGTFTKQNNEKVNGNALIRIMKDNENYFVSGAQIKDGELSEEIKLSWIPDGDYILTAHAKDAYGNEGSTQNISLKVVSGMTLATNIDKKELLPGDKLKIAGKITGKSASEEFSITASFGGFADKRKVKTDFEYDITVPDNVKSGENTLKIEADDDFGSTSLQEHKIQITQVIRKLTLNTDKESYSANETMILSANLVDQADDLAYGEVSLIIRKNLFKVYETSFNTKETAKYIIPENFEGAKIELKATAGKITTQKEITVMQQNKNQQQDSADAQKNIVLKGLDWITGNYMKDTSNTLNKVGYFFFIALFLVVVLVLLSHSKLKSDLKQFLSKKDKEKQDELDQKTELTEKLKSRIAEKHKENKEMKNTFKKYVDPHIVTRVMRDNDIKEGTRKEVTVFFADMRGFTKFAEEQDPEKVTENLNLFYQIVTKAIKMYNGTIDQLVGDQVFAVFNIIKNDEKHVLNAVKAALRINSELKKTNKKLNEQNKKLLKVGIGINTGEALISNVGSDDIQKFTVVGNTVNLGARLQEKAANAQILITEDTFKRLKQDIEAEDLGLMNFKNISKQINVFNVVGLK